MDNNIKYTYINNFFNIGYENIVIFYADDIDDDIYDNAIVVNANKIKKIYINKINDRFTDGGECYNNKMFPKNNIMKCGDNIHSKRFIEINGGDYYEYERYIDFIQYKGYIEHDEYIDIMECE